MKKTAMVENGQGGRWKAKHLCFLLFLFIFLAFPIFVLLGVMFLLYVSKSEVLGV